MIDTSDIIKDLPKARQKDDKKKKAVKTKWIGTKTVLLKDLGEVSRNSILESTAKSFEDRGAHMQADLMRSKKTIL